MNDNHKLSEAWKAVTMKWAATGAYDTEPRLALMDAIAKAKKGLPTPTFTANYFDLYDDHPDRDTAAIEMAIVARQIVAIVAEAYQLECEL